MPSTPQWRFGPFRLDLTNACLWQGDESIPLRPKPFAVLAYLMESSPSLPAPTMPPSARRSSAACCSPKADTIMRVWCR